MNDTELDRLLTEAGESFRARHTRAATPRLRPRRRSWALPLGAAVATAAVVAAVALVLPDDGPTRPKPAPVTGTLTLDVGDVYDVSLGEDYVALASSSGVSDNATTLQVRRRSDLNDVVFRAATHFPKGAVTCPQVVGPWVAWVDDEIVDSDLTPGPATRWSLELENLETKEHRTLASGGPDSAGPSRIPCPVGTDGRLAWSPVTKGETPGGFTTVSVLDLATGITRASPIQGDLLALTPDGQPVLEQDGPKEMHILVGSGRSERPVTTVPHGTMAASDGRTLLTFADDPATETADGAYVRVCALPACADGRQLAHQEGAAQGVVGRTFVAWSALSDSPSVRLLSGATPAPVAPGYVPFRTMSAYGDAFAYVTRPGYDTLGDEAPVVLHVQPASRS